MSAARYVDRSGGRDYLNGFQVPNSDVVISGESRERAGD